MLVYPSDILLKIAAGWKPTGYLCCFRQGLVSCSYLLSANAFLVNSWQFIYSAVICYPTGESKGCIHWHGHGFNSLLGDHCKSAHPNALYLPDHFTSWFYLFLGLFIIRSHITESQYHVLVRIWKYWTLMLWTKALSSIWEGNYFISELPRQSRTGKIPGFVSHVCNMWHCGALRYSLVYFKESVLPEVQKGIYY